MKNYLFIALSVLLITGCASHEGYTLTGEVPEAWEGKPVVLFATDAGQTEAIDSTTIADGKFRLQGVLLEPRNCRVNIFLDPTNRGDRDLTMTFPVFLDSTAVVAVCDASKTKPVFTLSGGATQTEWQQYSAALVPLSEARNRAFNEYVQAFYKDEDVVKGIELARRVSEKADKTRNFKIEYIRMHPESNVSLSILQELCDWHSPLGMEQMNALFGTLSPRLQESVVGRYTEKLMHNRKIVEGYPLPDLELVDTEGNVRRVSEFLRPGHFTLVEIWASWCAPCRGEIPFVKRAYDKYHPKGFDVLYISIDTNVDNWQQALGVEKMSWPQLVDTQRLCFGVYETTAVPTSLLLDEQGRIFKLNARGGWLDGALEEVYGK